MQLHYLKYWLMVIITISIALLLTQLPLPSWAQWYRPHWLLLVVLYWVMTTPNQIGIMTAWLIGLLLDTNQGTVLGEHALAFAITAFLAAKWYRRIKMFPLFQQACTICLLTLVYLLIIFLIQGIQGYSFQHMGYWLSAISSAVLWPWIFIILCRYQQRFNPY